MDVREPGTLGPLNKP